MGLENVLEHSRMTKRRYLKRANGVNCTLDTMASQDETRIVAGDEGEDELDALSRT